MTRLCQCGLPVTSSNRPVCMNCIKLAFPDEAKRLEYLQAIIRYLDNPAKCREQAR
jgi:hypothetical protein